LKALVGQPHQILIPSTKLFNHNAFETFHQIQKETLSIKFHTTLRALFNHFSIALGSFSNAIHIFSTNVHVLFLIVLKTHTTVSDAQIREVQIVEAMNLNHFEATFTKYPITDTQEIIAFENQFISVVAFSVIQYVSSISQNFLIKSLVACVIV